MENPKEQNYTKGFNAGYIVEKYGKPDFEDLEKYEFQTSFMQGFVDGKNQAKHEKGTEGNSQLQEIEI